MLNAPIRFFVSYSILRDRWLRPDE